MKQVEEPLLFASLPRKNKTRMRRIYEWETDKPVSRWQCLKCGYATENYIKTTWKEFQKGVPCPKCNPVGSVKEV